MQSFDDEEGFGGSFGVVGSFPKEFGYGPDDHDGEAGAVSVDAKPKILLMGLRRYTSFSSEIFCSNLRLKASKWHKFITNGFKLRKFCACLEKKVECMEPVFLGYFTNLFLNEERKIFGKSLFLEGNLNMF